MGLLRPDADELGAMARLASQPDFRRFWNWLERNREAETRNALSARPEAVHSAGRAGALLDVVDQIKAAPEGVRKTLEARR